MIGPPAGRLAALRAGAAAHLSVEDGGAAVREALEHLDALGRRTVKRLALIRNGSDLDAETKALLGAGDDVDIVDVAEADAIDELREHGADCAVFPLGEHADAAFALLEQAVGDDRLRELPLILYTPDLLDAGERSRLEELAGRVNAKAVSSPERLVDETALFLHRMEANLPSPTRKLLAQLRTADSVFHGKRILIVDDDIRNVFALTSALEMRGMKVAYAENGREGVTKLREAHDVDLVLLDVMMPEMDGYETARAIRSMSRFEHLPIISLTAKAMKGDRDKCIAAGASDYITKPVDMDSCCRSCGCGCGERRAARSAGPAERPARRRPAREPPGARGRARAARRAARHARAPASRLCGRCSGATSRSSCSTCRCRGWTASRRRSYIRGRERSARTPIIFLTAVSTDVDPGAARLRGRRGRLRPQAVRARSSCARRSRSSPTSSASASRASAPTSCCGGRGSRSPTGVALVDAEGRVVRANPALVELLEGRVLAPGSAVGATSSSPPTAPRSRRCWRRAMDDGDGLGTAPSSVSPPVTGSCPSR